MQSAKLRFGPMLGDLGERVRKANSATVILILNNMDCIDKVEDFVHYLDNPGELQSLDLLLKESRDQLIRYANTKFGIPSDEIAERIGRADKNTVFLMLSKIACICALEDFAYYLDNPEELAHLSPFLKVSREKLMQSAKLRFGLMLGVAEERVRKASASTVILLLNNMDCIDTLEDFVHYLDNPGDLESLFQLIKESRDHLILAANSKFGILSDEATERIRKADKETVFLMLSKMVCICALENFAYYLDNPEELESLPKL
jgi:hypothetical protein